MTKDSISSVGWLNNHDGSIALAVTQGAGHTFVSISKQEYNDAGGIEGLKQNKQLVVDFFDKYGAGRP